MRCPNGTRKNKLGVCEPNQISRHKYPKNDVNGTRKNKQGECEPKTFQRSKTPRTKYTCKFFKKQIYLSERIVSNTF